MRGLSEEADVSFNICACDILILVVLYQYLLVSLTDVQLNIKVSVIPVCYKTSVS